MRDCRPWPPTDPRRASVISASTVTAVICAAFDAAADDAVMAVRDRIISEGVRLPSRPAHRPHLTLVATRVAPAQLPSVVAVSAQLAAQFPPLPLSLSTVGRFERAGALWLGPAEAEGPTELRRLQQQADATLTRAGWSRAFGDRSAASWVPHCTLATRLPRDRLHELQARLQAAYRPIDTVVAAVAVILVGGSGDIALTPL